MTALAGWVAFGLGTTVYVVYRFRNCKYEKLNIVVANKRLKICLSVCEPFCLTTLCQATRSQGVSFYTLWVFVSMTVNIYGVESSHLVGRTRESMGLSPYPILSTA